MKRSTCTFLRPTLLALLGIGATLPPLSDAEVTYADRTDGVT